MEILYQSQISGTAETFLTLNTGDAGMCSSVDLFMDLFLLYIGLPSDWISKLCHISSLQVT